MKNHRFQLVTSDKTLHRYFFLQYELRTSIYIDEKNKQNNRLGLFMVLMIEFQ